MNPTNQTSDALQCYLKEVAVSKPLSADEEAALASRIKKGDMEARAELIEANLRFVVSVALKYRNSGLPLEDLISAGNMGLITAAERFDETKEVKFISYAVWWIRQAILQTRAEHTRVVHFPASHICLLQQISRYTNNWQQETGSLPSEEEIADELGISVEQVVNALTRGQQILSLDADLSHDDKFNLLDILPDKDQDATDTLLIGNSLKENIEAVLLALDERERKIIKLHFGLDGEPAMTLGDIGKQFNLTRERIRQIKEKALHKLRHPKRARKLMVYAEEI